MLVNMSHWIVYHNTEKMGFALHHGDPLRILTNKPVQGLTGNTVWVISGEGIKKRTYSLGSVFIVDATGEATEHEFKHCASGSGHVFRPPVPIDNENWFGEILRTTGNFAFGLREVKNPTIISALLQIAHREGCAIV